jgi:hypothetical protein
MQGPLKPLVGIEPTTARLRIECSTPELQWHSRAWEFESFRMCKFETPQILKFSHSQILKFQKHGADRDRTGGLCSAIAALSQLSYSPSLEHGRDRT